MPAVNLNEWASIRREKIGLFREGLGGDIAGTVIAWCRRCAGAAYGVDMTAFRTHRLSAEHQAAIDAAAALLSPGQRATFLMHVCAALADEPAPSHTRIDYVLCDTLNRFGVAR
jgi:hypothetical protein